MFLDGEVGVEERGWEFLFHLLLWKVKKEHFLTRDGRKSQSELFPNIVVGGAERECSAAAAGGLRHRAEVGSEPVCRVPLPQPQPPIALFFLARI